MSSSEIPLAVRLGRREPPHAGELLADARRAEDGRARLAFAADWGRRLPRPGLGSTTARWELLATAAAVDLTLARTLEPHADALAVLAEAGLGDPPAGSTWGVYAAEGPGVRLAAHEEGGRWRLSGTKPWCSLAASVSHALVTAWVDDERRGLFAVELAAPGVRVGEGTWAARGLAEVTSGPIHLEDVSARPVGGPGWYLVRDGFAWGGMGVAAVWYGAAVALGRRLREGASRREPDQIGLMHLGAVDRTLTGARAVLAHAALAVDAGQAGGEAGALLALRVRGVVAAAAEEVLDRVDHALGPAPLTQEEEHARRVADLRVYLRQHHAERDDAALGTRLLGDEEHGW